MLKPLQSFMNRYLLTVLIILFTNCFVQAQTDSLKFPDKPKLSTRFLKAIHEQTNEYNRLFYKDTTTKKYFVSFILDKINNDSNYAYLFVAEHWIAFHYPDIIPELIKLLTYKKYVGLVNTADLIIWERIEAKQMQFYGHGRISKDDLFTVAGRANRLLKEISGEDFGNVSMYSTQDQLQTIQKEWIKWLYRL